jgi:hypothetical protein
MALHQQGRRGVAESNLVILPYTIIQQQAAGLAIDSFNSSGLQIEFTAPQNNLPGTYNNNMFVWTAMSDPPQIVPWYTAAMASSSMQDGVSAVIVQPSSGTFPAGPYVLGYSVGPSVAAVAPSTTPTYPNVCATAMIPASWDPKQIVYFAPSIGIGGVTTNSIMFSYALPQGVVPSQNNAWIGFWRNAMPLYTAGSPIAFTQVNQPDSAGNQGIVFNPGLSPGTFYTAGLFASGYSKTAGSLGMTALCASITFQTGQPPK